MIGDELTDALWGRQPVEGVELTSGSCEVGSERRRP